MKNFQKLVFASILLTAVLACQRKPGSLSDLKNEMMANGYAGKYWQPESNLEKMVLNLIGINDLMVYGDDELNAFIFKIKEGKDPHTILDSLETYVREFVKLSDESEDWKNDIGWEQIRKDAKIRSPFLLLWFGENEEKMLKVFRDF